MADPGCCVIAHARTKDCFERFPTSHDRRDDGLREFYRCRLQLLFFKETVALANHGRVRFDLIKLYEERGAG
jgi:hypothetical protein